LREKKEKKKGKLRMHKELVLAILFSPFGFLDPQYFF
jgi:hypothetical protein